MADLYQTDKSAYGSNLDFCIAQVGTMSLTILRVLWGRIQGCLLTARWSIANIYRSFLHNCLCCRILTLVGYEPVELIGKTAYHFHNPLDAEKIKGCHNNREYPPLASAYLIWHSFPTVPSFLLWSNILESAPIIIITVLKHQHLQEMLNQVLACFLAFELHLR